MPLDPVFEWEKLQEIRRYAQTGRLPFLGDGSVRFVGPTLSQIVCNLASSSRPSSIGAVILGPADASGWKPVAARLGVLSWAWEIRRPTPGPESDGIIAVLIGLLFSESPSAKVTTLVLGPTEENAFRPLRPYLAGGAKLHLLGGQRTGSSFHAYDLGFQGGVFVQT